MNWEKMRARTHVSPGCLGRSRARRVELSCASGSCEGRRAVSVRQEGTAKIAEKGARETHERDGEETRGVELGSRGRTGGSFSLRGLGRVRKARGGEGRGIGSVIGTIAMARYSRYQSRDRDCAVLSLAQSRLCKVTPRWLRRAREVRWNVAGVARDAIVAVAEAGVCFCVASGARGNKDGSRLRGAMDSGTLRKKDFSPAR